MQNNKSCKPFPPNRKLGFILTLGFVQVVKHFPETGKGGHERLKWAYLISGMSCGWAKDWGSHQVWYTGRSSDEKKLWPPAKGLTGVKAKELRVKTKGSGKPGDSVCELCVSRKWGNSPITSASDVKKPGFSSQWAHTKHWLCTQTFPLPDELTEHYLGTQ